MLRKITRAGSIALVLVAGTLGAMALRPGTPPVAPGVLFSGAMIDRPTLHLLSDRARTATRRTPCGPGTAAFRPRPGSSPKTFVKLAVTSTSRTGIPIRRRDSRTYSHRSVLWRAPAGCHPRDTPFCTKRRFSRPGNASLFRNGAERRRNGFVRPSASPPDHSVKRYNTAWSGEGKPV